MTLLSMKYKNFRNIESAELHFDRKMNLICGINGQGKTNALEAICLLATGRSYRSGMKEKDYIMDGKDMAVIIAEFETKNRRMRLEERIFRNGRKEYYVNGIRVPRVSDFYAHLSVVAFFPEYMSIVRDGPRARRSFLDIAISQVDKKYMRELQKYMHILEQRNKLLARSGGNLRGGDEMVRSILVWTEQLTSSFAAVAVARKKYLKDLEREAGEILQEMSGEKETLKLEYRQFTEEKDIYRLYTANLGKEAAVGTTCYGVHRDDFSILLNGRPARTYASEGQRKSIAIALKLGEARISNSIREEQPVILLDDVLSELDPGRQEFLLGAFPGLRLDVEPAGVFRLLRQFVITTCDRRFARVKPGWGKRFFVEKGVFEER